MDSVNAHPSGQDLHARLSRLQLLLDDYDTQRAQAWAFVHDHDRHREDHHGWRATGTITSPPY